MDRTPRMSAAEYRRIAAGGGNNADTSLRNRRSNDRGRLFEELLVKGCRYYADRKTAIISKVYEPYICTKNLERGFFVGRHTGRAEPDFKGVLRGGRAIAFEAKSTQKERIERCVLTAEQMQWLDSQLVMGAKTYVCVCIQDRFFTIPWHVWYDMEVDYGRKYLTAEDIPEYEVIFDGSVRFLEYIGGRRIE